MAGQWPGTGEQRGQDSIRRRKGAPRKLPGRGRGPPEQRAPQAKPSPGRAEGTGPGEKGPHGATLGAQKTQRCGRESQHLSQPMVPYSRGQQPRRGRTPLGSDPGLSATLDHRDSKQNERAGPWHRAGTRRSLGVVDTVLAGQAQAVISESLNHWTTTWFRHRTELLSCDPLPRCHEANTPTTTHLP